MGFFGYFFFSISFLFALSQFMEDDLIHNEMLSEKVLNLKQPVTEKGGKTKMTELLPLKLMGNQQRSIKE